MAPPVPQGLGGPRRLESSSPGPRTGRLDFLPCIVWACLGPLPAWVRCPPAARGCGPRRSPAPAAAGNGVPRPGTRRCPRSWPAWPRSGPARPAFRGPDGARGSRPGGAVAAGREGGTAAPASPLAPVGCSPALFCIIPAPRQLRSNGCAGAAVSLAYAPLPWARSRRGRRSELRRGASGAAAAETPGHGPAPRPPPAPPRALPSAVCVAEMSGGQQRCRLCTGQAGGGGLASL